MKKVLTSTKNSRNANVDILKESTTKYNQLYTMNKTEVMAVFVSNFLPFSKKRQKGPKSML